MRLQMAVATQCSQSPPAEKVSLSDLSLKMSRMASVSTRLRRLFMPRNTTAREMFSTR